MATLNSPSFQTPMRAVSSSRCRKRAPSVRGGRTAIPRSSRKRRISGELRYSSPTPWEESPPRKLPALNSMHLSPSAVSM